NRVRYRNPELDKLLQAGRLQVERSKRKPIYSEVQKILARDVPVISLWHEDNVAAMRRPVHGFELLPTGLLAALARTYKDEEIRRPWGGGGGGGAGGGGGGPRAARAESPGT